MKWEFGEAVVITPGKHGDKDYRATFHGFAPTLGEYVLLMGGLLMAEDRYDGRWRHARNLYLGYLRETARAKDMDEVARVAQRTLTEDGRVGLPNFTRCHKGGKNECVSLCFDCYQAGFRLPDEVVRSTLRYWGIAPDDEIEKFVEKVQNR